MTSYYLDSSAWVKRHVQEPGTAWVNGLFGRGGAFACASIGIVEVISALSRHPQITHAQLEHTVAAVRSEFGTFEIVELTQPVLERAMDLPMLYRLRGADAIHLASAMAVRNALAEKGEIVFVSSDRDLLAAAEAARFTIVDPAKEGT